MCLVAGALAGETNRAYATAPDASLIVGSPAGPPLSGDTLEEATRRVSSLLRCPTCQGLSVAASPSEAAVAMRGETKDLLAAGYDEEQILLYFEASYGEFIRLEPKAEGFNLAVWGAPIAFVGGGGVLVALAMRRRKVVATAPVFTVPDHLAPYLEVVRRETSE